MIGFTAADGITLGIACVGAFTGIIALVLNVHQFLVAGPRMRVETEPARLGPNSRITGGKWDYARSINATAPRGQPDDSTNGHCDATV